MIAWLKRLFGPAQRPAEEPIDVAIGVRTGAGVLLRDGQPVLTLPADAVQTMGRAIDHQRIAGQRQAKTDKLAREKADREARLWAQTEMMPTLTDAVGGEGIQSDA